MNRTLSRYILVTITMLALLGQGVLSNGHAMVMSVMNDTDMMQNMPVQQPQMMTADMKCHDTEPTETINCCDDKSLPNAQHCCDGVGNCQSDCHHCLTISITANLLNIKSWPEFSVPELAMATPMPHFHSISLTTELRPPIA